MKRKILIMAAGLFLLFPVHAKAEEIQFNRSWATAYCTSGTTASGTQTVEGVTVAGKKEWIGKTMCMWEDDGSGQIKPENFIGIYCVEDTGGETIQSGAVIDVYISTYDRAVEFGSRRVIFTLIDAEG